MTQCMTSCMTQNVGAIFLAKIAKKGRMTQKVGAIFLAKIAKKRAYDTKVYDTKCTTFSTGHIDCCTLY